MLGFGSAEVTLSFNLEKLVSFVLKVSGRCGGKTAVEKVKGGIL